MCVEQIDIPRVKPPAIHNDFSGQPSPIALSVKKIGTFAPVASRDVNGKSDPYCIVWFDDCKYALKTPVLKETLSPVWDFSAQPMTFGLEAGGRATSEGHVILRVECWDSDSVGSDDFIGFGAHALNITEFPAGHEHHTVLIELFEAKQKPTGILKVEVHWSAAVVAAVKKSAPAAGSASGSAAAPAVKK